MKINLPKISIFFIVSILSLMGIVFYFQENISEKFTYPEASMTAITGSDITEEKIIQPIANSGQRITKKPFGLFVTKTGSPVQPERFAGFHTGADFEIFPGEEDRNIEIFSICTGRLLVRKYVNGYGGVLIQECNIDGQVASVLYGHLNLNSIITIGQNEIIEEGQLIGSLGKGYSPETDNERKHLHLSIHKGKNIDLRGYVQSKAELVGWINPCIYFCGK